MDDLVSIVLIIIFFGSCVSMIYGLDKLKD
jgi:hypothetical protein